MSGYLEILGQSCHRVNFLYPHRLRVVLELLHYLFLVTISFDLNCLFVHLHERRVVFKPEDVLLRITFDQILHVLQLLVLVLALLFLFVLKHY